MSFPTNPKHGLVHKHKNGYTYVYNSDANSWDKLQGDITPVVSQKPTRKTRKAPKSLKPAKPTINVNALNMGVSNELS